MTSTLSGRSDYCMCSMYLLPSTILMFKTQGITFNLIITGVDRGEATQPMSQTFRSNNANGSVPLHTIHIQTTISRYPPEGGRSDSSVAEPEIKQPEWK
jgi:hypothetical protein